MSTFWTSCFSKPESFYLLDRGYVDFARLYIFTQACAFFITRARKDLQFYRRYSRPVERSAGLRCDQTILLTGVRTAKRYPDPLRRIHYFDVEKDLRLTFLTNNFLLSALTIAQLYRARWQVELFFRWIKQHLRIKAFYGTSGERGEDSSLGGRLRLRAGGDCQKTTGAGVEPLQNLADSQRDRLRENPHFRRVFQLQRRVSRTTSPVCN